jgi:hypothetical protein
VIAAMGASSMSQVVSASEICRWDKVLAPPHAATCVVCPGRHRRYAHPPTHPHPSPPGVPRCRRFPYRSSGRRASAPGSALCWATLTSAWAGYGFRYTSCGDWRRSTTRPTRRLCPAWRH